MSPEPAIYIGTIGHRRFQPVAHHFCYNAFMVLLDLDRMEQTLSISHLSGLNCFRWASFHDEDHFGDVRKSLRERLRQDAATQGLQLPPGKIFLLTQLRYLGYCFNPISFFYCFDEAGQLELVMAEVNNTFGETVNYWLHAGNQLTGPPSPGPSGRLPFRHRTGKQLHVSPFMGMDMQYEFSLTGPGKRLVANIRNLAPDGSQPFEATLILNRLPWTAGNLRRTLFRFPWMTAKTIAAIHFEAVRLFLKRAPFHQHPEVQRSRTGTVGR